MDKPIIINNPKDRLNECAEVGELQSKPSKASRTVFQRMVYDKGSDTSLVKCIYSARSTCHSTDCTLSLGIPKSGRTHQIRVHLKHLGFPIANDPIYHPLYSETCNRNNYNPLYNKKAYIDQQTSPLPPGWEVKEPIHITNHEPEHRDEECLLCTDKDEYFYPIKEEMWLHASLLSDGNWTFKAPLPAWAQIG